MHILSFCYQAMHNLHHNPEQKLQQVVLSLERRSPADKNYIYHSYNLVLYAQETPWPLLQMTALQSPLACNSWVITCHHFFAYCAQTTTHPHYIPDSLEAVHHTRCIGKVSVVQQQSQLWSVLQTDQGADLQWFDWQPPSTNRQSLQKLEVKDYCILPQAAQPKSTGYHTQDGAFEKDEDRPRDLISPQTWSIEKTETLISCNQKHPFPCT